MARDPLVYLLRLFVVLGTEVGTEELGIIHLGGVPGSFYVVPMIFRKERETERWWTGRGFYVKLLRYVEGKNEKVAREGEDAS